MRRFILIDPWLADAKGHNYQYALDVAGAARERGYQPILAVRQALGPEVRVPGDWQVERVFQFGECARHWIGPHGRSRYGCDVDGRLLADERLSWWRRWIDLPVRMDRRRRLQSFVRGCSQLFQKFPPHEGDLLYLPSLSEFDFLGAVRFWRDHPWTREFEWHLQFHFNLFTGRDPEFPHQAATLSRFQRLFRAAVDQIPAHRLHFYATTEAIARQYDALGVAIFHPLPYPVRPLRGADKRRQSWESRPLRVTLPGAMRREKGKKRLGPLIDSSWDAFLRPGRIQFVLQASPKQIEQWLPRRLRTSVRVPPAGSKDTQSPLLATAHPLNTDQYTELIRSSDIGLFIYDSQRYFARASGVLCEMLSAGVPVIVPAGCWLAGQIAGENFHYVDELWRRHRRQVEPIQLALGDDEVIELPTSVQSLLLRFSWPADTERGTYAELSVQAGGSVRKPAPVQREILELQQGGESGTVIHFAGPTTQLRISLKNAYDTAALNVETLRLLPLPAELDAGSPPLGSVGLIAADERQVPRLLRDMTAHYGHYARLAHEFAQRWQADHSPLHTIARLEARSDWTGTRRTSQAA